MPLSRALLVMRRTVTWGNFAWFSVRTLLLSANDQLIKRVEEHRDGASVVDRRRMRWVAQQRDRGIRAEEPVSLLRSRGILMLGDPGEMDASQYVLVRDLALKRLDLKKRAIDNVLLMSDVVYPAGDVDQWADAVYLPYFGLPQSAWKAATKKAELDGLKPPFTGMRVFALPGNHDWYDGLNGFMYHACGAEPLPEVSYDRSNLTWRARLVRRWWRNPADPRRELLWDLREIAPITSKSRGGSEDFLKRAAVNAEHKGLPNVKGPYYALDLGNDGHDRPLVRIIVVDTGVKASIDLEQASVIRRWLKQENLPKIVVTGIPLLVNNRVEPIPISVAVGKEEKLRHRYLDETEVKPVSRTLLELMRAGKGVIATIAGDTHNYQRIQPHLHADENEFHVDEKWSSGLPPVQIVAGGAGAYLSQTHSINHRRGMHVNVQRNVKMDQVRSDEPVAFRTEFPSREQSVLHFFRNLRGPLYFGLLAAMLVIAGGFAIWADRTSTAPHAHWEVGVHAGVLFIAGLWIVCVYFLAQGKPWMRGATYVSIAVVLCAAALGLSSTEGWRGELDAASIAVGVNVLVLTLLVPVAPAVVRGFSQFWRSWPVLIALVLVLFTLQRGRDTPWPLFVALFLAILLLFRGSAQLFGLLIDWLQRWQIVEPRRRTRTALFVVRLLPTLVTVGGWLVLAAVFSRLTLKWLGLPENLAGVVQMETLVAFTTVLLLLPVAGLVWPMCVQWRVIPMSVVIGAILSGACAGFVARTMLDTGLWAEFVFVAAAAMLWSTLLLLRGAAADLVDEQDVRRALERRDGGGGPRANLATAARMVISSIPSVDSMAEATEPPFYKNVLELEVHREPKTAEAKATTVVTLTAHFLKNESTATAQGSTAPGAQSTAAGDSGLFEGDRVTLRYQVG